MFRESNCYRYYLSCVVDFGKLIWTTYSKAMEFASFLSSILFPKWHPFISELRQVLEQEDEYIYACGKHEILLEKKNSRVINIPLRPLMAKLMNKFRSSKNGYTAWRFLANQNISSGITRLNQNHEHTTNKRTMYTYSAHGLKKGNLSVKI